jgi:hypothetical protein
MPSKKHTHKYRRYVRGNWKTSRYACADPDCYKVGRPGLLLGKKSICWNCGQEFILTRDNLETAKPKCINCADTKEAREHRRINETVQEMASEFYVDVEKKGIEEPII